LAKSDIYLNESTSLRQARKTE